MNHKNIYIGDIFVYLAWGRRFLQNWSRNPDTLMPVRLRFLNVGVFECHILRCPPGPVTVITRIIMSLVGNP